MTSTLDKPKTTLWSLALESQEIDGQLAIAYDLITSEDPEERAQGETLITELLQAASANQALFKEKLNGLCHIRESLLGKAAFLKQTAEARLEQAKAAEKRAESLLAYATRVLEATNPGQKKFELPEFTISSRRSKAVELDESYPDDLPDKFFQSEITIKVTGVDRTSVDALIESFQDELQKFARDVGNFPAVYPDMHCDWSITPGKRSPSKTAIKAAIERGQQVPGAQLVERRNWSVK